MQGDSGDYFYLILDGIADIVRQDSQGTTVVESLTSGDYCGESAILFGKPLSNSARARTRVNVLALPKDDFIRIMQEDKQLIDHIRGLSQLREKNKSIPHKVS